MRRAVFWSLYVLLLFAVGAALITYMYLIAVKAMTP